MRNYAKMKTTDLDALLRGRGLPTGRNKPDMVVRLERDDEDKKKGEMAQPASALHSITNIVPTAALGYGSIHAFSPAPKPNSEPMNYLKMKGAELEVLLKERGLPTDGRKWDLAERLVKDDEEREDGAPEDTRSEPVNHPTTIPTISKPALMSPSSFKPFNGWVLVRTYPDSDDETGSGRYQILWIFHSVIEARKLLEEYVKEWPNHEPTSMVESAVHGYNLVDDEGVSEGEVEIIGAKVMDRCKQVYV